MAKIVEDISTLKINILSQAQYEAEVAGGTVAEDELYFTPSLGSGVSDVEVDGESVVSGGVAQITMPVVPEKVSDLLNDLGFLTSETDPTVPAWAKVSVKPSYNFSEINSTPTTLSGYGITDAKISNGVITLGNSTITPLTSYTETDPTVPSWAKASSKPSYTASEVGAVPTSRTVNGKALSSNITLSASDVSALPSSTVIPTITDTYSGTSSDGMSGKAVKSAIDALDGTVTGTAGAGKTLTAFSQTNGKVTATFGNISITKSQVSDFPTIPTVNNATLTIQKNGTTVKTFTANASSNVTANIIVPTDTDDLTNGAGYITSSALPTNVSELTNDAGYITGYKAPLIVRIYTTPSIQYAANQATWIYAKDWHAPEVEGYIPIGVLQASPNSGGGDLNPHIMIDYATYGDRLIGEVRNVGSAVTITMVVPILYIRDDLYEGGTP